MLRIAFVLLILSCGSALSQGPAPSGPETSRQEQSKPEEAAKGSATEQKTTAPSSIIVHVEPTPKTEAEAEADRQEHKEKAALDRRLVDLTAELSAYTGGLFSATVVLAVSTIALVIATVGLLAMAILQSRDMKASVNIARDAAKAARDQVQLSRHALISVERATISIVQNALRGRGQRQYRRSR